MARVLLAGVSTRDIAESAVRAGYEVVAVDGFGDLDLQACATEVHVVRVDGRFSARAAAAAARDVSCEAVVYEASFENHPSAVRALATNRVLWGNPPSVLARARDPRRLARVVADSGLPSPRVRLTRPASGTRSGWLVKPLRSGGGDGVAVWRGGASVPRGSYFQERISGVTGSLVFAADGRRAVPLGLSRVLAGETAFGADGFRSCGCMRGPAGGRGGRSASRPSGAARRRRSARRSCTRDVPACWATRGLGSRTRTCGISRRRGLGSRHASRSARSSRADGTPRPASPPSNAAPSGCIATSRSEEHTSELQSR